MSMILIPPKPALLVHRSRRKDLDGLFYGQRLLPRLRVEAPRSRRAMYKRLNAAGFKVWFDKTCLQPGYNRHEDIEEGYEKPRHIATVDAALEAIRVDAF
jgi:hypothetical protein